MHRLTLFVIWLIGAGAWSSAMPRNASAAVCGHVGTLLAFVALDEHTIAGSTDAGNMARSTDGGRCWSAAAVDSKTAHRLGEFLRDPHRPDVLLAGAGNLARVGFPITYGLLRSADGGKSWRTLGQANGLPATRFTVVSLVATTTALFAALNCPDELAALQGHGRPLLQCGYPIFRSVDDGRTWRPAGLGAGSSPGLPYRFDSSVQVLAAGPGGVLYAAVSPLQGDTGLYRSVDTGNHWALMAREDRLRGATALVAPSLRDPVVLAGVGLSTLSGQVLRSSDAGRRWKVALGAETMQDPLVLGFVVERGRILCAGLQHLYVSTDAGLSWSPLAAAGLPVGAPSASLNITYLERAPGGTLLLAMTGGLFRSTDDGRHWQQV